MATEFHLLGTVDALVDGQSVDLGHNKQRGVLAVLLMHANGPVPVDRLLDHVWGEHPPRRGRDALYSYMSRLRTVLATVPGASLDRGPAGYVLRTDEGSIDLHRFRRLAARARSTEDGDKALNLFDEALALWKGAAFADLDSPWFASMRTAAEAERRAVHLDRTEVALRAGHHADLLADLATQIGRHPLDERLAGQMMTALYRAGRPADALGHYRRLRRELADQLGTDPGTALQELHQRILTADPGLAAPVHPAAARRVTPRQLPPAPAGFTGRTGEMAALTDALDTAADANTASISALAGSGGIGKTWLALHWAHRHADRFPDGQLFVDLRGFSPDADPLDPLTATRLFLDALGLDHARLTGGLAEHTAHYRSHVAGKRMLILHDNAADAEQVAPLLPGSPSCTAIVTSRRVLTQLLTRHGARHLHLDVLSDAEAHALFAHRMGRSRVAAEPRAVTEVISLCGRYPLALSVMASRIQAHPHLPLTDFATELREAGLDALDGADHMTSLPAVLSWSLRDLNGRQRAAFALLGVAPGPDIALPAAASLFGVPLHRARTVLRDLADASLLDRRPHERYAMHDLVRAYAATAGGLDRETRDSALRRLLDHYTHTAYAADRLLDPHRPSLTLDPPAPGVQLQPLPDASAALAWFDAEHPNVVAAQRAAVRHARHATVWQLAWATYTFQYRRGHHHDRLAMWQAALNAAAGLADPAIRILVRRFLGSAYIAVGNTAEAIGQLCRALALAEQHHDLHQQAHSHYLLTLAWGQRGDNVRALEHARPALNGFRALKRPVWEASALNDLGWYTAQLGEFDTARRYCQDALALYRNHHDPGGEGATLDSLGYIEHHTGHHRQAACYYQQALTLFRALGSIHETADTLDDLGHTYAALGERELSRAVWREALELYRRQGRAEDVGRLRRQLADSGSALGSDLVSDFGLGLGRRLT